VKASYLDEVGVQNDKGEAIGTTRDLVLDTRAGKVSYAIVGHGGTAGVGEKHFAVPFDVLKLQPKPGDPKKSVFVVVQDKAYFDNSPGFDKNTLPSEPDPNFYGKPGQPSKPVVKDAIEKVTGKADGPTLVRVKALFNMKVRNPQGEDLGRVYDMMIAAKDGSVAYTVVAYGGVARVGDKMFAVDWKNLAIKSLEGKPNDPVVVLEVAKGTFDSDPGFDKNNWPSGPDKRFGGAMKKQ